MEHTLADRIKTLKAVYCLDRVEFCNRCGLSYLTVLNLEKGKISRPKSYTLKKIVTTFGTSAEWLLYGRGEMLPQGIKPLNTREDTELPEDHLPHSTYEELKLKNDLLEKELDRLWKVVAFVFEKEGLNGDLLGQKTL